MKTLREIGEFGLLAHLGVDNGKLPQGWLGPGDDCALIPIGDETLAITADILIEGVHFRLATTSAADLGYKALAASLSDLASMGATPLASTLSIALPFSTDIGWIEDFYSGIKCCADEYRCHLVGGDTSSGDKIFINITALGKLNGENAPLRSGAAAGEDLWVSGTPGESRGGLLLLEGGVESKTPALKTLIKRHTRPTPRVDLGAALAKGHLATSMIDISDGITKDAAHIARRSGVSVEISIDLLPLSAPLMEGAAKLGVKEPRLLVLAGGEDYELLFTANTKHREEVLSLGKLLGVELTRIGRATLKDDKHAVKVTNGVGDIIDLALDGFEHFK